MRIDGSWAFLSSFARQSPGDHSAREIGSMRAVVEELLARDLIVLDGIDTDFFEGDALSGGLGLPFM